MNRSLAMITAALAMYVLAAAPAAAEQFWHNGSLVELEWGNEGDGMMVYYVRPRSGLPVGPGELLFHGASPADGSIYGTAYIFSSKCGGAGYEVRGRFSGNNFTLRGEAPVRDNRCRVVRYEWNNNSTLRFTAR